MRICVCIKEVPPGVVPKRLDPDTGFLLRGDSGHLNPPDTHALEEALRIRDAHGDCEVVTVTMAPAHATNSLRHGLAMGADRAVLVADDTLRGSDLVATSKVLAAVLEREAPRLTLFGWEGTEANGAMLWAAVGERLGLPVVSRVWELAVEDDAVRAKRQMEYGFDVVAAPLPCVVALSGVTNAPRYPTLKGVVASKRQSVDALTVADLGLAPDSVGRTGSRTTVLRIAPPPARDTAHVLEDGEDAPARLLEYLIEGDVI
jgi:electron transfer flavoprotein beta subunit